jgi:3-methyladenine DNA glycosylase AlkD
LLDDGVINNWDLIDSSAPYLGQWLIGRPEAKQLRLELAYSPSIWKRRAAIMLTAANIRVNDFEPTVELANHLLNDSHDLVQKAVGWMLREVGNRDVTALRRFLKQHASVMPRTMLRYSIEKLEPEERAEWLGRKAPR